MGVTQAPPSAVYGAIDRRSRSITQQAMEFAPSRISSCGVDEGRSRPRDCPVWTPGDEGPRWPPAPGEDGRLLPIEGSVTAALSPRRCPTALRSQLLASEQLSEHRPSLRLRTICRCGEGPDPDAVRSSTRTR